MESLNLPRTYITTYLDTSHSELLPWYYLVSQAEGKRAYARTRGAIYSAKNRIGIEILPRNRRSASRY